MIKNAVFSKIQNLFQLFNSVFSKSSSYKPEVIGLSLCLNNQRFGFFLKSGFFFLFLFSWNSTICYLESFWGALWSKTCLLGLRRLDFQSVFNGNIPDINKNPNPSPQGKKFGFLMFGGDYGTRTPSKCKKPVASCGHQFKNWWQPYALPGAKRPSSPVVLPVHEKIRTFISLGSAFWVWL